MAIGIIRKALRKATKPKSKSQQLNERIKKAQRTKGIKGAKEEFKARDEKKAFEKRKLEKIKKEQEIKRAKEKAKRKGKGAIQTTKPKSFKQAVKEAGVVKKGLRVVVGGKGKDASAKPVGLESDKLGKGAISQRRRKQRIKNEIEISKFKRYIRDMDLEDLQNLPTGNKAAFERLKSAELDRQLPKSERDAMYKLFSKRYNLLKAKRLKQGKPVPKLKKGGMTMPMHGKKKSKMMARGGMKKKSKMMARGGMKKSKMYARGGAARRR